MDDSSSTEEEMGEGSSSPKVSVKKLKMNDGSSQDSLTETATSSRAEETEIDTNADSGVSVGPSESVNTEVPVPSLEPVVAEPWNEVVAAGPSTSNIHTILFNIRRPRRNYRRRRTPGDSDSSTDSDDIEAEDMATSTSRQTENSDDNEDPPEIDLQQFVDSLTDVEDSGSGINLSPSNDDTNSSYSDEVRMLSVDSDTEDEIPWRREEDEDTKTPPVLLKTRPKHNYFMLKDIINREIGLMAPTTCPASRAVQFEKRFYGSLHAVYRLKLAHKLQGHRGCVNAIDFHPEGRLLASGSDDTNVIVWEWATGAARQTLRTGHKANVFQSKFLHLNARSQLNIVTCSRDGQVRLIQCPPSGGGPVARRRLAAHTRSAMKLHVCAGAPHDVISCGEDGQVLRADVRADKASKLFTVRSQAAPVPLYSVAGHPAAPERLVLGGRDRFVRVYDTRHCQRPVSRYCPAAFTDNVNASRKNLRISMMHLTCAVYNHDGTEILASYNDDDIYLFDTKNDVYDKDSPKDGYTHRYSGHRNSATFKGVSYFGPNGQYIVSGSDCTHLFIWDKETEAVVQWRKGDVTGVVNCIEAHPSVPVLATCGLDRDVKLWLPRAHSDVSFDGLEKVIKQNSASHLQSPLFNDFLPSIYSAFAAERPRPGLDQNVCTAF